MNLTRLKQEPRALAEIGVILAIPLVLLILHAVVPSETAAEYYFYPWEPTLFGSYTATLLHSSWTHVISNAFAFTVIILTAYIIHYWWGRRRLLWHLVAAILITAPPVIGYLDVIVLRDIVGVVTPDTDSKGFSGVVGAFLGMYWASLGYYTNHRTKSDVGHWIVFIAFLLFGVGFTITYRPPLTNTLVAFGAIGFGFIYAGYQILNSHDDLTTARIREWVEAEPELLLLLIWSVPAGLVLALALFPPDPGAGGTMTDIIAHLIGLVYGFLLSVVLILGVSWFHSTTQSAPKPS